MKIDQIVHCTKCKRPILDHEWDRKTQLAYCFGCDLYFPISDVSHIREEITVPNGTNTFTIRRTKNELELKIRYFRNYSFFSLINQHGLNELSMFYIPLIYLLNYTKVTVTPQFLKIENEPFDHLLPMSFYSSKIVEQLYVKPYSTKSAGLFARITNIGEVALLWNLKQSTLMFFEQEIERILGIEDENI